MKSELESNILYVARRRITLRKTIWFSIFVCLIAELLFFIGLRYFEHSLNSENELDYLTYNVLMPSGINVLTAGIYHLTELIFKKETIKNFMMVASISVICFTFSFTHHEVSGLLSLFCLPIFLTAMFTNKKFTSVITFLNILFYGATVYYSYYSAEGQLDFSGYYNDALISFTIIICSHIFTNILISYENDSRFLIASTPNHQKDIIEQIKRDPLTNLYNQKIFYDSLAIAIKQCDKICVSVIDIDNFKSVNDTYGHSVGDIVLVTLADMLKSISSKSILTARYGGEEFSIIFKDMTLKESYEIMEKLRENFSVVKFAQMNDKSVTFSCGITGDSPNLYSSVEFFNQADEALYYAKSHGKNQTVLFHEIADKINSHDDNDEN